MIHPPCRPPPLRYSCAVDGGNDSGSPSPSSNGHQALGGCGHKSHTDDPPQRRNCAQGSCEWTSYSSDETYRS